MNLKVFALATVLATTALSGAFAADAFDKDTVCEERNEANTAALNSARAARPDNEALASLVRAAANSSVNNAICLAAMLGEGDEDISAVLAEMADSGYKYDEEVSPAAGPAGGQNFGGGGNGPTGENPGQLNTPTDGGSSSPSKGGGGA